MRSLILCAFAALALTVVAAEEKKIVCYFGSWAVYRPGTGKFAIENIDPNICTHLIYTFVGLDKTSNKVKILDPWQDTPDEWGKDGFGRFNALRQKNPKLKTLIAVGGWNEGSKKYSEMAANPQSRAEFVASVVALLEKYKFNGFDVDWEYPAQRQGAKEDVQNYIALLKDLREALDKAGDYLLTAAVGAAESSASQSYDIPAMSKYLNFINLMTYDLHGSWESETGINAPLRAAASDSNKNLNVEACVKYWLSKGAPAEKLIVGTATYGRSFTLDDPNSSEVGAKTRGPGAQGPSTREGGMLGYNEICEAQNKQQWNIRFDEERRVPFASRGDQWVGYDNIKSIKEKAEFIKELNLGGAMVWSIETDDFAGNCGATYPLIKTLNHVLRNGPAVEDRPPSPPKEEPTTSRPNNPNNPNVGGSGDGKCTTTGTIPDPNTCEQFIQCIAQPDGSYQKIIVPCPAGLCYKPSLGICDWK